MWPQACRGRRMKAALESLRGRKGNSCEHLWTEETVIDADWVRKRKEAGDRAAGNSVFPLISSENTMVFFKKKFSNKFAL